ncbi:MAG: hypothetical protein J7M21_06130, partial [Planctomycetes bacterium]|nr:hypothetical protein [Planctomycetota bacterium]
MDARIIPAAMALMFLAETVSAGEVRLDMESAASLRRAKATPAGEVQFVAGREGKGARLVAGGRVQLPSDGVLTARRGTVEMWIEPAWDGSDPKRHTFFHMGESTGHITLFATGGRLL